MIPPPTIPSVGCTRPTSRSIARWRSVRPAGRSPAPASPPAGEGRSGFHRLGQLLGLVPLDLEILLIAIAPNLHSRFERLYGYLNNDVTRRRASVGLALELCGRSAANATAVVR
jgi:hypothetical protein